MARRHKVKRVKLQVPGWARYVYVTLSVILLPWTIYLGMTLPEHHLSAHWDASWVGLDIALIISLLLTGIFAVLRSPWISMSATAVGTLLLLDAWFDVMSERQGMALMQAIVLAFLVELPLAWMSFYLAYRVIHSQAKY